MLREFAVGLGRNNDEPLAAARRDILSEMAAIEEMLESHGAGSFRSRRVVRVMRTLMMAEMSLLLLVRERVLRRRNQRQRPQPEFELELQGSVVPHGFGRPAHLFSTVPAVGPVSAWPARRSVRRCDR